VIYAHTFLPVKPLPKGRPRVVNGRAYTPPETRAYEAKLRSMLAQWMDEDRLEIPPGDVRVDLVFALASGVHGDLDNLAKAVLDAAQGVAIANDKCVRDLRISRQWVREDWQSEGIHLYVRPLPDDPPPKRARKRKVAK
jgi:Holliday junction resolvase RusA-like endonuclease